GDLYAGALIRELRALDAGVSISGLGGPHFAAAGGRPGDDDPENAVTGLTEAVAKIPRSLAAFRRLVRSAKSDKPDALVAIDFPDFNFRLARALKRLGVPGIYYSTPQHLAWGLE